ncbi:DUF1538 domain-containing protein [Desulfogranum mediterraneum]|uniref:DUF1538 domain-containing protein n=1 Tax=Desulfogranum mediterraneum TaxID=160661 RepID=UPI0004061FFE|nr:DUF1538 domain-containing protein [Desulfogranum mediterraneum]
MALLNELSANLLSTCRDILPILVLIFGYQLLVVKQPLPNLKKLVPGIIYVILGLALFLTGLEMALFPLGEIMARQLSSPRLIAAGDTLPAVSHWYHYLQVYLFAAMIGFATTIAEPSLLAVAIKAREVSGGTISPNKLRVTVALGVAAGISLGTFRIVSGTPLTLYILCGYLMVTAQTFFAPKSIIPLAYDSGGVTTSTVTVPIVTALGLGLSAAIPGRNPAIDGFGLIAFASLFPIIAVLGYGQYAHWLNSRTPKHNPRNEHGL